MCKKESLLIKISTFLLAVAPLISNSRSTWFVGEPQLPKHLQQNNVK